MWNGFLGAAVGSARPLPDPLLPFSGRRSRLCFIASHHIIQTETIEMVDKFSFFMPKKSQPEKEMTVVHVCPVIPRVKHHKCGQRMSAPISIPTRRCIHCEDDMEPRSRSPMDEEELRSFDVPFSHNRVRSWTLV
ncbi:hypothetical protein PROFUN_05228 [Planoprotostelium fungivorum]|uniref:Uncharacterized protein n=1 Tax=Planoprotostelium fungivorum TaxID=1890364 RepID=A0A2P6NRP6_9EUKA|nr:hypothetical protein PROFUN_05228 [Planoprotostelium fungivorum]